MQRFRQFEDIPVWQAGRQLVKDVYRITRYREFSRDRGLVDQIRRAAVSITSNVAEGHERGTTRDLVLFLYYAKGSAGEVRSQLWNAQDVDFISQKEAEELRERAADISRQIYGWALSMQAPDVPAGPMRKIPQSRNQTKWEGLLDQFGLMQLPSGRFANPEISRAEDQ